MMGDEPPFLQVDTEVSAKYRGAFCEAKVKKIVKLVKVKVTLKDNSSSLTFTDDQIKGNIKLGELVEVKHPESSDMVSGHVTRVSDCSTYTVVFDDGDERTLRRSMLCLKGDRHFIESETLDNLPLSNPEHFGTPVMQDGKRERKRSGRFKFSSDTDSSSEDDECVETLDAYKRRYKSLIGKVVCIGHGDKKKTSLIPMLVVLPLAQTVKPKTKDSIILCSFKDGKCNSYPRRLLKEFTPQVAPKFEDKGLKPAYERAMLYYEERLLPPQWNKETLLGCDSDTWDEDIIVESSDDEPTEEKDRFVAILYKFMDDRGTPMNKGPCIGNKDLNLYKLFGIVDKMGGYNRVTNLFKWRLVYHKMNLPPSNNASHKIKMAYKNYLHAFENFYRKLGSSMGTSRPGRSRLNSGRSIFRDKDGVYSSPRSKTISCDGGKEKSSEEILALDSERARVCLEDKFNTIDLKDSGNIRQIEKEDESMKQEVSACKIDVHDKNFEASTISKKSEDIKCVVKPNKVEKFSAKPDIDSKKSIKKEEPQEMEDKHVIAEKKVKDPPLAKDQKIKKVENSKSAVAKESKLVRSFKNNIRALREKRNSMKSISSKYDRPQALTSNVPAETRQVRKRITAQEVSARNAYKPLESTKDTDSGAMKDIGHPKDSSSKKETKDSIVQKDMPAKKETIVQKEIKTEVKKKEKSTKDMSVNLSKPEDDKSMQQPGPHPVGTKLKVKYGRGKNQKLYEAKIVDTSIEGSKVHYLVHYAGWNLRHDEWIPPDRINSVTQTVDIKKTCFPLAPACKVMVNQRKGRPPLIPISKDLKSTSQSILLKSRISTKSNPSSTVRLSKPLQIKSRLTRSTPVEAASSTSFPVRQRYSRRMSSGPENQEIAPETSSSSPLIAPKKPIERREDESDNVSIDIESTDRPSSPVTELNKTNETDNKLEKGHESSTPRMTISQDTGMELSSANKISNDSSTIDGLSSQSADAKSLSSPDKMTASKENTKKRKLDNQETVKPKRHKLLKQHSNGESENTQTSESLPSTEPKMKDQKLLKTNIDDVKRHKKVEVTQRKVKQSPHHETSDSVKLKIDEISEPQDLPTTATLKRLLKKNVTQCDVDEEEKNKILPPQVADLEKAKEINIKTVESKTKKSKKTNEETPKIEQTEVFSANQTESSSKSEIVNEAEQKSKASKIDIKLKNKSERDVKKSVGPLVVSDQSTDLEATVAGSDETMSLAEVADAASLLTAISKRESKSTNVLWKHRFSADMKLVHSQNLASEDPAPSSADKTNDDFMFCKSDQVQTTDGGESPPTGDGSTTSNDTTGSSGNVPSSESSNDLGAQKHSLDISMQTGTKRKRKGSKRRLKAKHTGSDSDDAINREPHNDHLHGNNEEYQLTINEYSSHEAIPLSEHSPKYNFHLEEAASLQGDKKIEFLLVKIQEMRKIYQSLKAEVASIDRKRKRLRRRERQGVHVNLGITIECS